MTKSAPKIKIFYSKFRSDLETKVNKWLEDNNSSIRIIDVMASGNYNNGLIITIAYKDREDEPDEDAPKYGLN